MAGAWPALPTMGGKQLWGDVWLRASHRIQRHVRTGRHRLLDPADRRLAVGDLVTCARALEEATAGEEERSDHLVLLLHGIFRSKDSFRPMVRALRQHGYNAQAVNYPSTRQGVRAHADLLDELLDRMSDTRRVSFVGHSLGGLVARAVLARRDQAWRERIAPHRLVLLGTPSQGAEIADRLGQVSPFAALAGPALDELKPGRPAELPPIEVPFAIVAGGTGSERGFNPLLPGDNDMTVTVRETYLPGAEDYLTVPALHTFLMAHREVIRAVARYLKMGALREPSDPAQEITAEASSPRSDS